MKASPLPRLAALFLASLLATGCAHLPRADRETSAMDVARDVVLAVDNPIQAPAPHAGSNLLGYGAVAQYRNGQRAMATMAELKRQYGLREIAGWPIKPLGLYCAVLRPGPEVDREALLQALARDPRVRIAEPLHEYGVYGERAAAPRYNDPYVTLQRGFADIDAARAQAISRGRGVDVALVDTGVQRSHPDLAGRIREVHDLVGNAGDGLADERHGTEVAGVIAAVGNNRLGIVGVAPEATLSVYRACWQVSGERGARCNTFTLAKALAALSASDARIINLSLGGPEDPLLGSLLEHLLDSDRIVVAALPPDGRVHGFPAGLDGVIVVGTASAPGPAGVVRAPGRDILTTQPAGRYDFASGSSLAAAHVTGIAALLLAHSPALERGAIRDILRRSTIRSGGVALVNAAMAVAALDGAGGGATAVHAHENVVVSVPGGD